MAITGATMHASIRTLLRADARGRATDARPVDAAEISAALQRARLDTFKLLVDRRTPWIAPITCSRFCNQVVATDALDVPVDMYDLECGMDSAGKYLADEALLAEAAFGGTSLRYIAVRERKFRGAAAANALVWKVPTAAIADSGTTLTDFPDAFYHTIKYAAMRDLVKKDYGESDWRYKFFDDTYKRRLASLR